MSRSGSTGSACGQRGGAPMATASPPAPGVAISITAASSARWTGTVREPAGATIGSSTVSMPSS